MGYRDMDEALGSRLARHGERLAELDRAAPASVRRLPARLRRRLARLRRDATLSERGAHALSQAERAADEYEQTLDEALGLGAELNKWVRAPWPAPAVVARWAAFTATAVALLGVTVHQLHMTDFVLRALGANVGSSPPDLAEARIFFDLDASIAGCAGCELGARPAEASQPGKAPPPSGVRPEETERELLDRIVEAHIVGREQGESNKDER
jgi:hypothetical protein